MERRFAPVRQSLDSTLARLERAAVVGTERRRSRLAALGGRLDALSPLSTLARGYAVPRTVGGRVLRGVADFPAGLEFHLRLVDGTVTAESTGPLEPGGSRG